jgi:Ni,Fe-hydrogenase III component G
MNRSEVLEDMRGRFAADIVTLEDRSPRRVYVEVTPDSLPRVAQYLFRDQEARFHTASGVDVRSHLEILYHFSIETLDLLISLRVKLPRGQPAIQSIAGIIKGANWIEREIAELLGVEFQGHPDPRNLLLGEEWPPDVFPLRQDYAEWDPQAVRDRGV